MYYWEQNLIIIFVAIEMKWKHHEKTIYIYIDTHTCFLLMIGAEKAHLLTFTYSHSEECFCNFPPQKPI